MKTYAHANGVGKALLASPWETWLSNANPSTHAFKFFILLPK